MAVQAVQLSYADAAAPRARYCQVVRSLLNSSSTAFAIRPCYINPRTTLADVDALADEVELCGVEVWEALSA